MSKNENTNGTTTEQHYLESEFLDRVSSDATIFAFLQDATLDGLWYWDLEHPEHEWMNPAFWRLLGFDPAEKRHLASEWQDLIHPDDLELATANFEAHCADPAHPYDQIVRYRHRDGSTVWVRCRGLAIRDESGRPVRMLGAHTDLTELKRAEQALIDSRRELEAEVAERTRELQYQKLALDEHAIVSVTDVQGNITYVNDKFCTISGFTREELLGQNHRILKSGEHSLEFYQDLWRTIANGGNWNGKIKNRKKEGGYYWVAASIIPFLNEAGKPQQYVSIRTDITKQVEAEEAMAAAKNEAEAANRTKTEFLANMSHELRTPLNAVIGFAEMLEYGVLKGADAGKIEAYARNIGSSGRILLHLINDLLDFARIDADLLEIAYEPFVLAEEIDNTASAFELKAGENNVSFRLKSMVDHIIVNGDAFRMRQVIYNLVDNAIKFSQGGTVCLEAHTERGAGRALRVVVSVTDDGIGIEEEKLERIFDPFAQSDGSIARRFGGSGLGLPISRRLTRRMGGDVTVASTPGKGSIFTATFEFEDLTALSASLSKLNRRSTEQNIADHDLSILAVDDVEANLDVIEEMLTDLGCSVCKARNGNEAIARMDQQRFDLVLMDLHMPELDGVAAARLIQQKEDHRNTPICLWTADVGARDQTRNSGVDWAGTVIKPATRDTIAHVLRRAIEQRGPRLN